MHTESITHTIALGVGFFLLALLGILAIRRMTYRIVPHLSDVTGLLFISRLLQVGACIVALIAYSHVVPELRYLGNTLLTGVSVISVVIGLAAQNTLGNIIAGVSLVAFRSLRVGQLVQIDTPNGPIKGTVDGIFLGFTRLKDDNGNTIVIFNATVMNSTVVSLS
jgi:small-conductance mechanosensitive channel